MVTVQTKFQIISEYKQGHAAVELAERYDVSVRSIFEWLRIFDGSMESLKDHRSENGRERIKVTSRVEELIIKLRLEGMGYKRIGWRLKRKHGTKVSPTIVKHWLEKHGLAGYRKKRKGRRNPDRTRKLPNQLWRLDIKSFRIKGVGKVHDYVVIDDCTRTMFAQAYKNKTIANAIDFAKLSIKKYGRMKEIRVDNGTQFVTILKCKYRKRRLRKKPRRKTNEFGKFCKLHGIKLSFIPFGQPNKNAKIERAIKTIKYELIKQQKFKNLKDFNKQQEKYLEFYNNEREHGGLNGDIPSGAWKRIKKKTR